MKLESRRTKLSVSLAVILICSFIGVAFYLNIDNRGNIIDDGRQTFLFVNPVFAQSVTSDTTFLEEEAGIAIYVNVGQSIDLAIAKTVYRTIEKETSNYTIGSIGLPDLPESEDVHCFVHKDGWIVVYYLKTEPASKVINWSYYDYSLNQLNKTKLQIGLEQMGKALEVTVTNVKYYNFHYQEATNWMIIIDSRDGAGTDSFNLKIPGNFTVYERSWSHYAENIQTGFYYEYAYFRIDGSLINTIDEDNKTEYGQLTATQLSADVFHTASIECDVSGKQSAAITLVYKES